MNSSRIVFAALILGLAGDLLLRWVPWGFNVPLWCFLFLSAAVTLIPSGRSRFAIAAGVLLLAVGFAWRDSQVLLALDAILIILMLPMLAFGPRNIRLAATGLGEIAVGILFAAVQSVPGFFQAVTEAEWRRMLPARTSGKSATIGVLGRGVLIALPALVLFGSLLASADPAFEKLMRGLLYVDLEELVQHLVVTLWLAATCAGVLRSFAGGEPVALPERPAILRLPIAESNVALALVNILFALFVAVQVRYLFGGASLVKIAGSLTYAEYARRGFFELVTVVGLVLPFLLLLEWLVTKDDPKALRLLRLLTFTQIALVFVIAASAWKRMALYREAYGLTEQRFYTTAFMLWIAALLLWLSLSVLTGRRERFAAGLIVTAVVAVLALHAVNPDEYIARVNIMRDATGERPLDANYLASLGSDAVPALLDGFERVPPSEQPCVARTLEMRHRTRGGWRTWNASRVAAFDAVERRRPDLRALAKRCTRRDTKVR